MHDGWLYHAQHAATVAVPGELGTATADGTSAFVYAQGGTIAEGTTL